MATRTNTGRDAVKSLTHKSGVVHPSVPMLSIRKLGRFSAPNNVIRDSDLVY